MVDCPPLLAAEIELIPYLTGLQGATTYHPKVLDKPVHCHQGGNSKRKGKLHCLCFSVFTCISSLISLFLQVFCVMLPIESSFPYKGRRALTLQWPQLRKTGFINKRKNKVEVKHCILLQTDVTELSCLLMYCNDHFWSQLRDSRSTMNLFCFLFACDPNIAFLYYATFLLYCNTLHQVYVPFPHFLSRSELKLMCDAFEFIVFAL